MKQVQNTQAQLEQMDRTGWSDFYGDNRAYEVQLTIKGKNIPMSELKLSNKEELLLLISSIEEIEKFFHKIGFGEFEQISDVPEYQNWIQQIILYLQEIFDRTHDQYIMESLNLCKKRIDDRKPIERFIDYVNRKTTEQVIEPVYSLSNHGLLQIEELLGMGLVNAEQDAARLLKVEKQIQQELDKMDSYLAADIDEGEIKSIYKKLQKKIQAKYDLALKIEEKEQEQNTIEWNLNKATSEYQRAVEHMLSIMEATDDNEREIMYSSIAEKVLTEFSLRLQKQKVVRLAETITTCYKRLRLLKKIWT